MSIRALEHCFPQLERIGAEMLRQQVRECWLMAISEGRWEVDDLEAIPFSFLGTPDISLAAHTRNVTDSALALGRVLGPAYAGHFRIDFDILLAGGLLHDVGKCLEYERRPDGTFAVSPDGRLRRHPISGTALAARCGLPEAVQHIIAVHSREGDGGYRSPEAWIVHHSDFVNFEPLRRGVMP